MPPLNRFTTKAKDIVRKAHEVGMERGQNTINTKHLLTAILSFEDNIVVLAMDNLNIDYPLLYDHVLEIINNSNLDNFEASNGNSMTQSYQVYLSPELIEVLNAADRMSIDMNDQFISVEHLFISLIINLDEEINDLFKRFKIDQKKLIDEILKLKTEDQKEVKVERKLVNLRRFAKNLTEMARENKIDPVIGRDKEIERAIHILSRRKKNNPILIGEAGVGKTSIVEGIAQKIVSKEVPQNLIDKEIYSLDLGLLISGTKFRGEFEERLKGVLKDIESTDKKIILFIDETHMIVGAGSSDGSMDASNILKPALARGELSLIGATTLSEYRKYIEKDAALSRRFQEILVDEPSRDEAILILNGLKDEYEVFHGIKITDDAIRAAVDLSIRYLPERRLPDKAIDLIDEAASMAKISFDILPEELKNLENKLSVLEIKKRKLEQKGGGLDEINKEIKSLEEEIRDIKIK